MQAKLSYYTAWTKAESDEVGRAYETLVDELRKVAGRLVTKHGSHRQQTTTRT